MLGEQEWTNVAKIDGSSKCPLILYIYLMSNTDGYSIELSPAALVKQFGGSVKTWQRAISVLEENYYLIARGDTESYYDFYHTPQKELDIKDLTFNDFKNFGEARQRNIVNDLLSIDEDKWTEDQCKMYNYVEYVLGE